MTALAAALGVVVIVVVGCVSGWVWAFLSPWQFAWRVALMGLGTGVFVTLLVSWMTAL